MEPGAIWGCDSVGVAAAERFFSSMAVMLHKGPQCSSELPQRQQTDMEQVRLKIKDTGSDFQLSLFHDKYLVPSNAGYCYICDTDTIASQDRTSFR